MSNTNIEIEMIRRFGLDSTIKFCEMVSYMYEMMYVDIKERKLDDICDYDYDAKWWKDKHEELIKMNHIVTVDNQCSYNHLY